MKMHYGKLVECALCSLQDSHFIDITLDAPGSADIERRCHFGDGETLKYAYMCVIIV